MIFALRSDLPRLNDRRILYLGGHLVSTDRTCKNSIPPEVLDELLSEARACGLSTNLVDRNPQKLIVTFDDGRRFDGELERVLERHCATAIFFVCTERRIASYSDDERYWEFTEGNRDYVLRSHVAGGHTDRHLDLGALGDAEQEAALVRSKQAFMDFLGFEPWCFAYPWGRMRSATFRILRQQGVRAAFIAGPGRIPTGDLLIPRVFLDTPPHKPTTLSGVRRRASDLQMNVKLLIRNIRAFVAL